MTALTVAELPAYLCHLDAGLLPYRLGGAARFCYPLKMHEYLAVGAPVVSTGLTAVQPFSRVIRVAEGQQAWLDAIDAALADKDAAAIEARRGVARANSWDIRVETISRLIAEAAVNPARSRRR